MFRTSTVFLCAFLLLKPICSRVIHRPFDLDEEDQHSTHRIRHSGHTDESQLNYDEDELSDDPQHDGRHRESDHIVRLDNLDDADERRLRSRPIHHKKRDSFDDFIESEVTEDIGGSPIYFKQSKSSDSDDYSNSNSVGRNYASLVLDDDAQSNDVLDEDERLALEHSQKMASAICDVPKEQVVHVSDHYTGRYFLPHCTLLHRCGKHAGCCATDSLRCVAKEKEKIVLHFYSVRIKGKGLPPEHKIEKLTFTNHTRCGCELA